MLEEIKATPPEIGVFEPYPVQECEELDMMKDSQMILLP